MTLHYDSTTNVIIIMTSYMSTHNNKEGKTEAMQYTQKNQSRNQCHGG